LRGSVRLYLDKRKTELKPVMLGHIDDVARTGEIMPTGEGVLSGRFAKG
jgi:hypothetical protein